MKLIKSLQFAHAAELAAFHVYEGHWRSVSNKAEQDHLKKIQFDELRHICTIEAFLKTLGARQNKKLDKCGEIVGEIIGMMCYYTGWRLPMWVAGVMETIGTASYDKIALEAADAGLPLMAAALVAMAKNEKEHEEYFKTLVSKGS